MLFNSCTLCIDLKSSHCTTLLSIMCSPHSNDIIQSLPRFWSNICRWYGWWWFTPQPCFSLLFLHSRRELFIRVDSDVHRICPTQGSKENRKNNQVQLHDCWLRQNCAELLRCAIKYVCARYGRGTSSVRLDDHAHSPRDNTRDGIGEGEHL